MDYSSIFIIKKILQTSVLTVLNKTRRPTSKLYLHVQSATGKEVGVRTLSLYVSFCNKGQSSGKRLGKEKQKKGKKERDERS